VTSRVRAFVLVLFAVSAAAIAGVAALWVNGRERAADATAHSPPAKAAAGGTSQAPPIHPVAEAVAMHFENPHASSLPAEMAALGAARFHNEEGHPELALLQLQRLRSRYPRGGLQSESMVELAITQCALGKRAEAAQTVAELERLGPPTALVSRAKAACDSANAAAAP
jgi:hypothetical protein